MSDVYKLSPLDELHREKGGRMVSFAGWELPVMYSSILAEHETVRTSVGVFDISHMGQIFVSGEKSQKWLDALLTNDVSNLEIADAQYTFLLNESGGVIDDLILYRLDETSFFLVVNAAKINEVTEWFDRHLLEGITYENESSEWAGLAVQGPRAPEIYTRITGGRCLPAKYGVDDVTHEGARMIVCRTGYTGEDGFELFCSARAASGWFQVLMDEHVVPCGLGARDTLRLEMCYPLNGNDLTEERTPLEAGLGRFVAFDKEVEFLGREVLLRQKEEGVEYRLMAIQLSERGAPPRAGYPVLGDEDQVIGHLTSGALSPSLGVGIALAYLPRDVVKIGSSVKIEVRGQGLPAKVVKKPFYQH